MKIYDAMTTYRRDDGEPCGEGERWTTSGEMLQEEVDCLGEPITWIAEEWVRVGVKRFTLSPFDESHNPMTCDQPIGACDSCMIAYGVTLGPRS